MVGVAAILLSAAFVPAPAAAELRLETRRGSACEERKKTQLERLARHYPLGQELRRAVPDLPSEPPRGSGGERDSYLHLAVILLEWQALEQLVGDERARAVLEFKSSDHYTAIYGAVLKERPRLEALLARHRVSF